MSKIRKRIIITLFVIILLFTATTVYINQILIPVQLRGILINRAKEFLGRDVSVESIRFNITKGIVAQGIRISQKENPAETFLKADKISLSIILTAFIPKKQILIPSIHLSGVEANLQRLNVADWNFSDLLSQPQNESPNKNWDILIRKVSIDQSQINIKDFSGLSSIEESIKNITAEAVISLKPGVQFQGSFNIPQKNTSFSIKGVYLLKDKKSYSEIKLNSLPLDEYITFLPPAISAVYKKGTIETLDAAIDYSAEDVQIQGSATAKNAEITINNKHINGEFRFTNIFLDKTPNGLSAKGEIVSSKLKITFNENQTASADAIFNIDSFHVSPEKLDLQAKASITNGIYQNGSEQSARGNLSLTQLTLTKNGTNYTANATISSDQLNLKIASDKMISTAISAQNISITNHQNALNITGGLNLTAVSGQWTPQYSFEGNVTSEKNNISISPETIQIQSQPQLKNAVLHFGEKRSFTGDLNLSSLQAISEKGNWKINGRGQLFADELIFDTQKFIGTPEVELSLTINPQEKQNLTYQSRIVLNNAVVEGVAQVGQISALTGELKLSNDHLQTDQLTLIAQNTPFTIKGFVDDFQSPRVDINLSSNNINLARIISLIPQLKEKIKYQIDGTSTINARYIGLISDPHQADIRATAHLINASLAGENLPESISEIQGDLNYAADTLSWNQLSGLFKGKTYLLTGNLVDFSKPVIQTNLSANNISLSTQINLLNNAFQIISLKGQYLKTSFDVKGDVRLQESAEPKLDLRIDSELNLEDIILIAPTLKEKIIPLNPKGTVGITALFRGTPKDWRNWQLVLQAKSSKVTLNNYPFENLDIKIEQRDQHISKLDIASSIYDGLLTAKSTADLTDPNILFNSNLLLQNLNLSLLDKDQKINKDLKGNFALTVNLNGPALEQKLWKGDGAVTIADGYLGQWGLLKGVLGVLLILDEFKTVYVTDANATFIINNRRITTDTAQFNSKVATLLGKGWVDFDKNINFEVSPSLSQIALEQANSVKTGATAFISQAVNVQCTGTLTEPNCSLEKSPLKILEKTTDILKEGVQGILQEIF
jgi:hypothetical protein